MPWLLNVGISFTEHHCCTGSISLIVFHCKLWSFLPADKEPAKPGSEEWAVFAHDKGKVYTDFGDIRAEIQNETNRMAGDKKVGGCTCSLLCLPRSYWSLILPLSCIIHHKVELGNFHHWSSWNLFLTSNNTLFLYWAFSSLSCLPICVFV